MFAGAYLQKILRINLTDEKVTVEKVTDELYRRYLGGRGLAAYYYHREISPDVEPLSPDNKLIFMTGPLTGLSVPSSTKFQCATRSPETGIYLCTNSSGEVGPYLKRRGYDGLIIEGRAKRPIYLAIGDDGVEFRDAADMVMLETAVTIKTVREDWGMPGAAVMTVGPAAFHGVLFANIMVGDRSFGRGGAGAVMASKNLKAVAISSGGSVTAADAEKLKEINTGAIKKARDSKRGHTLYGTNQYTEVMNELGCYSVRNFTTGVLKGVDTISKDYVTEHYKEKNLACFRCPVACAQLYTVKERGAFTGMSSDPEYETVGTLGGVCEVTDFAAIIAANYLCDQYGIDTMTAGNIVGYAMECFERGIFSLDDTGGIELRFGNAAAMVEMVRQIGTKEGFGAILGLGFKELARLYPATAYYMMHVKWMPFAAYEPRGFFGMGLAYGTSNRGACHNVGGWTIRDELIEKTHDRFALHGKGELVKRLQDTRAYIDSLGICTVVRSAMGFTDKPAGETLLAAIGEDLTPELMNIGERIYSLERQILVREGIRREHDYLPERIMQEPLPEGPAAGKVLTRGMYDVMLDEYYRLRSWDENGVPTSEGLKALGVIV
ncbi:MAG TPA: aldehyde ferredoxin oxidoreductase family protein [Candidatus Limnocylindrales bacterium]|nr:aldehyde ferredoxin oxidoreductase family protein [Candidatus Limnocylindrales bacterium]